MELWLLQRRGPWTTDSKNVVLVCAMTEAHARVDAYMLTGDRDWTSNDSAAATHLADDPYFKGKRAW